MAIEKKNNAAPSQIKLEDLSVTDLKALAYDHIATIEAHQNEIRAIQQKLQQINNAIAKKLE